MGDPKDIEKLRNNRKKLDLDDAQLHDLKQDVKKIIEKEERDNKIAELEKLYGISLHS